MGPIKAWSFSRLSDFEACPFRAQLKVVDRVPEPARPLPPGKTEHANDRGTRIHDGAEKYIQGGVELLPELSSFHEEFARLKSLHAAGKVSLEGEWGFDDAWSPCAWNSANVWARIKLDAYIALAADEAVVVDYKTGRKVGNEVKHADQMQLYQLGTFLRYPKLEQITVELWYVDQNDITRTTFTREQGMRFFRNFDTRGRKMTDATEFKPKPNKFVCGRCNYKTVCPHSASEVVQKKHDAQTQAKAKASNFVPWE